MEVILEDPEFSKGEETEIDQGNDSVTTLQKPCEMQYSTTDQQGSQLNVKEEIE